MTGSGDHAAGTGGTGASRSSRGGRQLASPLRRPAIVGRVRVALLGRRAGLLGLALCAGAAVAGVAWAGAPVSGNPQAVALARAEVRAYLSVKVVSYHQSGYIELNDQEGSTSYLQFRYYEDRLAPGYSWTRESMFVALHAGDVVWYRDELTPPPCHAAGVCHRIPAEVVGERVRGVDGAFAAFGTPARHTCFFALNVGTLRLGASFAGATGRYAAPVWRGRTVRLTRAVPYPGGRALISAVDSRRTHLTFTQRIVLPTGHVISTVLGYPRATVTPAAPRLRFCR